MKSDLNNTRLSRLSALVLGGLLMSAGLAAQADIYRSVDPATGTVTFTNIRPQGGSFETVMRRCSEVPRPGQDGTWITEEMIAAYCELHRRGIAHSVEVSWQGELVGGLYGVALGRLFHGESMFHLKADASKVGFATLVAHLAACGYVLIDCQVPTAHLASLGAFAVDRSEFLAAVKLFRDEPPTGDAFVTPASDVT